ncbi:hypothetical protein BKA57DRAFT_502667 [Linnemannia elongata]|nr:hypothetical protein BKA57DRAFT_502667 [Linnemannia elongata]
MKAMSEQVKLLPETLGLIFRYLAPRNLSRCLYISRLWHADTEPQLYRNMLRRSGMTLRKQPLAAYTRKHLIHRVEFSSNRRNEVPLANAPDFLFDYHLPNSHVQRQYGKNIEIVNMGGDHSFSDPSGTRSPDLDAFLSQGLSPILEAIRCDPLVSRP